MVKCRECEEVISKDVNMGYCPKCYKKVLRDMKREECRG